MGCLGSDVVLVFFFLKQKTAYEIRPRDLSSDVFSSDLPTGERPDHNFCIAYLRCSMGGRRPRRRKTRNPLRPLGRELAGPQNRIRRQKNQRSSPIPPPL